jgi:hypothetical protein
MGNIKCMVVAKVSLRGTIKNHFTKIIGKLDAI